MPTFLKVFRRQIPMEMNYVSNNADEWSQAYEFLRKMNKGNFMLAPWHNDKIEGLYCCT